MPTSLLSTVRSWMERSLRGYPRTLLTLLLILLLFPSLFYNFGLADLGLHAEKGAEALYHSASAFWEPTWLTSILTGLWLELTGRSLFALRVASLLTIVVIAVLIHAIIRPYYGRVPSVLGGLLPLLLLHTGTEHFIPSYYIVPPLFGLASLLFCMRAVEARTDRRMILFALLSGAAFALLLLSRLPSAPLLILYPTVALILGRSEGPRKGWRLLGASGVGLVLGLAIALAVLEVTGLLDEILIGLRAVVGDTVDSEGVENMHHPFRLLIDTSIRYAKVVGAGGLLLLCCWGWSRLFRRISTPVRSRSLTLLLVAVAVLSFILTYFGKGYFPLPLGGTLALFLLAGLHVVRSGDLQRTVLFVSALCYMVMMNVGSSNNMSFSLKYTALLVVPLGILESWRISAPSPFLPLVRAVMITIIVALFFSSRLLSERDLIFHQDGVFTSEALRMTYSNRKLTGSYNELTKALEKIGVREGDTLLAYVDIPMLHFTTATVPALVNPYVSDLAIGYPSIGVVRRRVLEQGFGPPYVVRANPNRTSSAKSIYLDSLFAARRYDTVWRSRDYVVMKRREKKEGRGGNWESGEERSLSLR